MSDRPPIVILTALDPQYRAVRDVLGAVRDDVRVAGVRFVAGRLAEGDVVLAVAGAGTPGVAFVAERAIRVFRPSAVLFAGLADSLKPEVRPGDIVVATRVYGSHGAVREVDHGLERAARRLAGSGGERTAGGPMVHFGPIVAGGIREHDDALATETGLVVTGPPGGTPAAVIRGIRDPGGGLPAVERSARFTLALSAAVLSAGALTGTVNGRAEPGPR